MTLSQMKEQNIDFHKEQKELLRELECLLELFDDFRDIVSEQSLLLDEVRSNTGGALEEMSTGNEVLTKASALKASTFGAIAIPVLAGGIGALLGGPIGAAFGVKAGLMMSGAGVATGVGVGYYLKKKKQEVEEDWEWIPRKNQ